MIEGKDYRTVSQVAASITGLSENSLRWHIFKRSVNGLDERKAVLKVGRRVLLDFDKYCEWLESSPPPYTPELEDKASRD
jgi:hypothetical protein